MVAAFSPACAIYDESRLQSSSYFLRRSLTVSCSHSSWPTIPQLYIGGEFVGGCDIAIQMHQSGELEKLLVEHKLIEAEGKAEPGAEA